MNDLVPVVTRLGGRIMQMRLRNTLVSCTVRCCLLLLSSLLLPLPACCPGLAYVYAQPRVEIKPYLPPELDQSYTKLKQIVQDEKTWYVEANTVCLSATLELRQLLANRNLTLVEYNKLVCDCHLVRTVQVDLYFVRTRANKYFLYKAVPR